MPKITEVTILLAVLAWCPFLLLGRLIWLLAVGA